MEVGQGVNQIHSCEMDLTNIKTIGQEAFTGMSSVYMQYNELTVDLHKVESIENRAFRYYEGKIKIDLTSNSLSGAPWGARGATIEWYGTEEEVY